MVPDRRAAQRKPVGLFFNKYIDKDPHLGEVLELSGTGMLARTLHQPNSPRACYAVELASAGSDPVWLCARSVWGQDGVEALAFVAASDDDRRRLEWLVASLVPS